MYAAHTIEGQLIYAHQVKHLSNYSTLWFCPHCSKKVTLKTSSKGKAFFSHSSPCKLERETIKRRTKETDGHLAAKRLLAEALIKADYEVMTEYYIEAIQQVADLIVLDSDSIKFSRIIEFQRSQISPRLIDKRQQAYLKSAKRCIWLVDYEIFAQRKIQTWHQTMLQYSKENGFHWFSLDLNTQRIVVKHHAPLIYLPLQLHIQEDSIYLDNPPPQWLEFADTSFVENGNSYKGGNRARSSEILYQKRLFQIRKQKVYQKDLQALYSRGHVLHSLPSWILTERWQFLVTKSPGWLVFAWGYVTLTELGSETFSTRDYTQKMKDLLTRKFLRLAEMPLIEGDMTFTLAEVMLEKFKEKGLISQCGLDEWQAQ